jgi:RNA polymerase sigma factor (TIGR02999 family)
MADDNKDPVREETASAADVTALLASVREGNRRAEEQLLRILYRDLRKVAAAHLRREVSPGSMSPTGLVNEAYLRIFGSNLPSLNDRKHFLAFSSTVMRRILVDRARRRKASKRASGKEETLSGIGVADASDPDLILSVDQALGRLAEFAPRAARVVELRFFGGLELKDVALAIDSSERTVHRDWLMAKNWLHEELSITRR